MDEIDRKLAIATQRDADIRAARRGAMERILQREPGLPELVAMLEARGYKLHYARDERTGEEVGKPVGRGGVRFNPAPYHRPNPSGRGRMAAERRRQERDGL